jgi:hypothetical protein
MIKNLVLVCFLLSLASPALAQNYSADARRIALGGVGSSENIASQMVQSGRRYRSVVIPLGTLQLLGDLDALKPDEDEFDLLKAMEYAASPMHYTFGRSDEQSGGSRLMNDIVNARLNRDLNVYRVFEIEPQLVAEGLANPSWGKTFRVRGDENQFQGVYVGAGPYLAVGTSAAIDPRLVELLGASTDTYFPNAALTITDVTTDQIALAITGGYRARMPLPGQASVGDGRNGTYLAANYHYLHGFHMDQFSFTTRFDTNSVGLLTVQPTTAPILIDRVSSPSGRGFALDAGVAFVVDEWSFGFGANGIANRMTWDELEREQFTLQSLIAGGDFVEVELPGPPGDRRFELPVVYSTDVGYDTGRWAAVAEYAHGFQGNSFHSGLEYRLDRIELRGGGRLSRDRWYPSGGVGFNVTPAFGIDVALFGKTTLLERRRQTALAISIRFEQPD